MNRVRPMPTLTVEGRGYAPIPSQKRSIPKNAPAMPNVFETQSTAQTMSAMAQEAAAFGKPMTEGRQPVTQIPQTSSAHFDGPKATSLAAPEKMSIADEIEDIKRRLAKLEAKRNAK